MIKTPTITRPLLALAAAIVSVPLAAKEPVLVTGQQGEPFYQEQVSFADLDLRQSRARQLLSRRVMQASTNVCIQAEGRMNMNRVMGGPENTCPNRTYRAVRPQITAAIRRATSSQPHPATALVVAAPAPAR